jgi:hypothetical protein
VCSLACQHPKSGLVLAPAALLERHGVAADTLYIGEARIDEGDWQVFRGHLEATLDAFKVPAAERADVLGFIESTKQDIVE